MRRLPRFQATEERVYYSMMHRTWIVWFCPRSRFACNTQAHLYDWARTECYDRSRRLFDGNTYYYDYYCIASVEQVRCIRCIAWSPTRTGCEQNTLSMDRSWLLLVYEVVRRSQESSQELWKRSNIASQELSNKSGRKDKSIPANYTENN